MYKIFLLLSLFALCRELYAQKIVYYGNDPKQVEVNAYEQTMLSFPAAAYAYHCNPSDVFDFHAVENLSDYDQMTLQIMKSDKAEADKVRKTEAKTTARLLKLLPLKPNKTARCIFRLADEDVINVSFFSTPDIMVPAIDFRPISEQVKSQVSMINDGKPIGVFRELLKGGNLSFLNEVTPKIGYNFARKITEKASYVVTYAANDSSNYSVWRISAKANAPFEFPKNFSPKIGQLLYSAYKKKSGKTPIPLKLNKDENFYIYLMGSLNLTKHDVLGMMP